MLTETLKQNVYSQLGYDNTVTKDVWEETKELFDTLEDVSKHGANCGFGAFCYHSDTVKFAVDNKKDILKLCQDLADDLGEDVISMIASFNCLKDMQLKPSEIGAVIYGSDRDSDEAIQILNALAWFALEETANDYANN